MVMGGQLDSWLQGGARGDRLPMRRGYRGHPGTGMSGSILLVGGGLGLSGDDERGADVRAHPAEPDTQIACRYSSLTTKLAVQISI